MKEAATLPIRVLLSVIVLASCFSAVSTAQLQAPGELIFDPAKVPFASSHASTVVQLHDGTLLTAWFGGSSEGATDVAIYGARRESNGWTSPAVLVREPGIACWNPVLFHARDGRLWLYYKFGPSPGTWTGARMHSEDEGMTWSMPEYLPAGLLGPIRAKPLVLDDGTIVSGSSVESYRSWAVWIERSTDGGQTWAKIGPIVPPRDLDRRGFGDATGAKASKLPGAAEGVEIEGIIQPSVISLGGTRLRLYARSTAKIARVCVADSYDRGLTWTEARPLDVPNPNSGVDAVALWDGRVVLLYNETTSGRTPLNLAVSKDGEHFTMFKVLENGPGEFSYPALIQVANGDLEMTYTWNRRSIRHVHVALAEIPSPGAAR